MKFEDLRKGFQDFFHFHGLTDNSDDGLSKELVWYKRPFHFLSKIHPEDYWKFSIILAATVHVATFTIFMLPPSFFHRRQVLPEFYTVDLFNVTPEPQIKTPIKPVKIAPAKKKVKVAPAPKSMPVKQVSVNPIITRKKIEQKEQEKKLRDEWLQSRIEQIKAEMEQQKAMEDARDAAKDAVSKIRDMYSKDDVTSQTIPQAGKIEEDAEPSVNFADLSMIQKQYWAEVTRHIQSFWSLPDLQNWESTLTTIAVIRVHRSGAITKKYFESKSNNLYFNQLVEKTIQESLPLPQFPPGLREEEMEIGLVFHPTGLTEF